MQTRRVRRPTHRFLYCTQETLDLGPWSCLSALGALHSQLSDHWTEKAPVARTLQVTPAQPALPSTYTRTAPLGKGWSSAGLLGSTDMKVRSGEARRSSGPGEAVLDAAPGARARRRSTQQY